MAVVVAVVTTQRIGNLLYPIDRPQAGYEKTTNGQTSTDNH